MKKINLFEKYSSRIDNIAHPGLTPKEIALWKRWFGDPLNNRDKQMLKEMGEEVYE